MARQSFGGSPKATSRESGIGFRSPVSTPRGAIRAGLHIDLNQARSGEAFRGCRGGRLPQGVRVRCPERQVDAARLDVGALSELAGTLAG